MAKSIVENIKTDMTNALSSFSINGLGPGCPIWVIEDACYDCPDNESCREKCDGKDKRYLEKRTIFVVKIVFGNDKIPKIHIEDTEGGGYALENLNVSFFIDRKEAIKKL